MRDVIVYVAYCKVNGKVYVGITSQGLPVRIRKHQNSAKRGSIFVFHRALMKYGFDNFSWEECETGLSWEEACSLEKKWIKNLRSTDSSKGYNLTGGGEGSFGCSPSLSSRSKVSKTLKEWWSRPESEVLRDRLSKLRRGTRVSLETRKKLAKSLEGRELSRESREKISASKMLYPEELRREAVCYAGENSYHAAERYFGIPRQTIRRWSKDS